MSLKEAKSDEFYCESVAKSISEIIRFSLDEEFRKTSFDLFGVTSTKETEKEISCRLMSILKNKSSPGRGKISRKRKKKLTEERGEENIEKPQYISDAMDTNQPSSSSTNYNKDSIDFRLLPQKFFQKNWLQMSSKQYRDAVKRRKLNYFSQPQFSKANDSDIGFCNTHLHFSNSQPTSASDPCASFNEMVASSHQLSGREVSFCQNKFNLSFEDDIQRFLKEKIPKSQERFNF